MINDLGCRDLADRRKDRHLTLFYKISNHEVNVISEGIPIQPNGGTSKGQAHNKFILFI